MNHVSNIGTFDPVSTSANANQVSQAEIEGNIAHTTHLIDMLCYLGLRNRRSTSLSPSYALSLEGL
jgi:hypothetical protein